MFLEPLEDRRLLALLSASEFQALEIERAFERVSNLSAYSQEQLKSADEWVVQLAPGSNVGQVAALLGTTQLRPTGILPNTYYYNLGTSVFGGGELSVAIDNIGSIAAVRNFYPLVPTQYAARFLPNDPMFNQQWHLLNSGQTGGTPGADANVELAWDIARGQGVVIGVVDTGTQTTPSLHADLVAKYQPALSWDFNNNDPVPDDCSGHGTSVSGVAAATTGNGLGVSGAAPDALHSALKLICGGISDGLIAAALDWGNIAGFDAIDIYNNSWGPPDGFAWLDGPGPLTIASIQRNTSAGNLYVWAGGNGLQAQDNVNYDGYANHRLTIGVGAIDHNGKQSFYSERGSALHVTAYSNGAPGAGITTTDLNNGYTNAFGGTSSASPLVAGVLALIKEANPNLSYRDFLGILATTARKTDATDLEWKTNAAGINFNHKYGWGAIDAHKAVTAAKAWTLLGPEVFFTSGRTAVNAQIPDADTQGLSRTVSVTEDFKIESATVTLTAGHQQWGNLEVQLRSPSGMVARLAEPHLAPSGFQYSGWTFSANNFWGENSVGDWTVTVIDPVGGNVGSWGSFELNLSGEQLAPPPGPGPSPAPSGIITGFKFNDLNGNGAFDTGEPRVKGVYIYVDLDNDDRIDAGEPAAITDANGVYSIKLNPGKYTIREVVSPGWVQTFPASGEHQIDLLPNMGIADLNFGNMGNADFGDAPAPYPTTIANKGASHGILPGMRLGDLIDGEVDGLERADADGDNRTGLNDEDGVDVSKPLFAGLANTITVKVNTGGFSPAALQGFFDFNADGDWNDPGEHAIKNLVLGTGTHQVTFTVPANAKIGPSFARFRYGYERNIGPTGAAMAGEVEDYKILILANQPLAVDDSYIVNQDSVNNMLNVLLNDFRSSSGQLTIVSATQPAQGSVTVAPNGSTLFYTPNRNFFSPPADTFRYTVDDGTGATSTATVFVTVAPTFTNPAAVDDTFQVSRGTSNNIFNVLANDIPGVNGPLTLISTTQPGSGTAVIDRRGTPSPLDDRILYTPGPTFSDTDQFNYTVSNAVGFLTTATVTVREIPAPQNDTVSYTFDILNASGNPATSIEAGQNFTLVVSTQDVRFFPPNPQGVAAAYLDILYDRTLVSVVPAPSNQLGFAITFSNSYGEIPSGSALTPGIIDEVGAFQRGLSPLGSGRLEVFRVNMLANAEGTVEFIADPANQRPDHDTLLFDPVVPVPLVQINYDRISLNITASSRGTPGEEVPQDPPQDPPANPAPQIYDVNGDGRLTPLDALLIINFLNLHGSQPANGGGEGENDDAPNPLDVSGDGRITPLDALLVINQLNAGLGGEGERGEFGPVNGGDRHLVGTDASVRFDAPQSVAVAGVDTGPRAAAGIYHGETDQSSAQVARSVALQNDDFDSLLEDLAEDVLTGWAGLWDSDNI